MFWSFIASHTMSNVDSSCVKISETLSEVGPIKVEVVLWLFILKVGSDNEGTM